MSREALPCIVCGAHLDNAFPSADNQPLDGTAFTSTGHYGSTFFDPMDGQQLEINVCDGCLTKHTARIAWCRAYRPIVCDGAQVGLEYLDGPLVPYAGQNEPGRPLEVEVAELGTALSRQVMWNAAACEDVRQRLSN